MKLKRLFYVLCYGSLGLGVLARVYNFWGYEKRIFDEVYFPTFAASMLKRVLAFDAHPPLGKMLMAVGIGIFGDNSLGWRIIPFLFGLGLLLVFFRFWRVYFPQDKPKIGAWLLTSLVALEGMFILYSRVGLMDDILLFFIMSSFLAAVGAKNISGVLLTAVLLGLAVSIKWYAVLVVVPIFYVMWRRKMLGHFVFSLPWTILTYLGVGILGELIGRAEHPWSALIQWHSQVWDYETTLTATHPWSSVWYGWPLQERPLLMVYDTLADGRLIVMTTLSNPLLWWSATLAVLFSLAYLFREKFWRRQKIVDHPLVPLLIGYLVFFFFWFPIHRILFIYHYLPAYAFSLIILTYWLWQGWEKHPRLVIGFLLLVILLTLYFLPLNIGLPVNQSGLNGRIWFSSWL